MSLTHEAKVEKVREYLREVAQAAPESTELIARHVTPAHQISIPVGMSESTAVVRMQEAATAANQVTRMPRQFNCRPGDGALAVRKVFKDLFGVVGAGKPIMTFFGKQNPTDIPVVVGVDERGNDVIERAPWGLMEFAPIEGTLFLGAVHDNELGDLFTITAEVKKARAAEVDGLFVLLENYIRENSIYRAKSIIGTKDPKFINLKKDPGVVYTRAVEAALDLALWGVLESPEALKYANIRTNPQVLLHGTYGTGKSEAARQTAQIANANGWTFIQFESSSSSVADLENTLKTARLMAPAVVFVEDIDTFAPKDTSWDAENSKKRLLEMLDGLTSKSSNVIVLMTTNNPDALPQGSQRAGRITSMIEVGYLDQEATVRLLQKVCGPQLGEIDEDEIYQIFQDYPPAFTRQAVDVARQAAILRRARELKARNEYSPMAANLGVKLGTEDFRGAAAINAKQWESYRRAGENRNQLDPLQIVLAGLVRQAATDAVRSVMSEQLTFNNDNIGEIEVESISI